MKVCMIAPLGKYDACCVDMNMLTQSRSDCIDLSDSPYGLSDRSVQGLSFLVWCDLFMR